MSNPLKICIVVLALAGAPLTQAAAPSTLAGNVAGNIAGGLHRGDFVRVSLLSGPVYHLRLSGLNQSSLVGLAGNLSVHLPRSEIASVEREAAPSDSNPALKAWTALLNLLRLSAAHSFGAGQACNGSNSGC